MIETNKTKNQFNNVIRVLLSFSLISSSSSSSSPYVWLLVSPIKLIYKINSLNLFCKTKYIVLNAHVAIIYIDYIDPQKFITC